MLLLWSVVMCLASVACAVTHSDVTQMLNCSTTANDADGNVVVEYRDACSDKVTDAFIVRNCFCDAECPRYGDCCVDSPLLDAQEKTQEQWICNDFGFPTYGTGAYVKATCPPCEENDVNYRELRDKCERHLPAEDPFSALPVSSVATRTTYQNVFCGICNNESGDDLVTWGSEIICSSHVRQKLDAETTHALWDLMKTGRYDDAKRRWYLDGFESSRASCSLTWKEPTVTSRVIRHCKPHTATCSADWTDETIHRLCGEYTAYVYEIRKPGIYRNPHCALCNHVTLNKLSCQLTYGYRPAGEAPVATATASSLVGKQQQVGSKECRTGHVLNPFTNSCEFVACGKPGGAALVVQNGRCKPSEGSSMQRGLPGSSEADIKGGGARKEDNGLQRLLCAMLSLLLTTFVFQ